MTIHNRQNAADRRYILSYDADTIFPSHAKIFHQIDDVKASYIATESASLLFCSSLRRSD